MEIKKTSAGSKLTVAVEGRLDTVTSPALDTELQASYAGVTELVIDMAELTYISSAGLRVLLSAQKVMNKQGRMLICNANDMIKEIFEVTGFSDILTVL